ncbi:MAG: sugar phosphate isomerase/epimerase family protein [Elusimicrobiota bacterium]
MSRFKVGLSTYSLSRAIKAKEFDILGAIQWIKDNGGEFVELSYGGLADNPKLVDDIREKAKSCELDIASYTIGAAFIQDTDEKYRAEIERMKKEVEIGARLGVKRMRHDAAGRPKPDCNIEQFMKDLPKVADACREIADHAKKYGITTSVENHGFFMQKSDRVQMLINAVGRENFRTTIDIGNFLCADEDPVVATKNNIRFASHVHFKDFYIRKQYPGEGWINTLYGNYLRGAIIGFGDVDTRAVLQVIKESTYEGYLSIEFEGGEECKLGSKTGIANLKRLVSEL